MREGETRPGIFFYFFFLKKVIDFKLKNGGYNELNNSLTKTKSKCMNKAILQNLNK